MTIVDANAILSIADLLVFVLFVSCGDSFSSL